MRAVEAASRRGQAGALDEKCSLPRIAKASNLGRGWNFTWESQAALEGHPPWEAAGGVWGQQKVPNTLRLDSLGALGCLDL